MEHYLDETEFFCQVIQEHSKIPIETLLHLGCGGGHNDYILKKYYRVTGVDISKEMLKLAMKLNHEVTYKQGDMRMVRLQCLFDAVAAINSIDYMLTRETDRNLLPEGGLTGG